MNMTISVTPAPVTVFPMALKPVLDIAIYHPGARGTLLVDFDAIHDQDIVLVPTHTGAYITMTAHVGPKYTYAEGNGRIALLMWSTGHSCWTCPMYITQATLETLNAGLSQTC